MGPKRLVSKNSVTRDSYCSKSSPLSSETTRDTHQLSIDTDVVVNRKSDKICSAQQPIVDGRRTCIRKQMQTKGRAGMFTLSGKPSSVTLVCFKRFTHGI